MKRSFRLRLLSLFLRLVVKTALGLIKTPWALRARSERIAGRLFRPPEDANFVAFWQQVRRLIESESLSHLTGSQATRC